MATGRAERDPSGDLRGAIPPASVKHMATITDPKEIGGLLRSIDGYQGSIVTRCALQLAPVVFVRPGELRHAEWSEIDFETAEWRIPAEKMKAGTLHIVPLSRQALAVLQEIHPLTCNGRYVFPSPRTINRPMSSNAVLSALRRMGYAKDEMSGHGFRSMASTLLNEQGWNPDAIERQLAHGEKNSVRAAYNYAEFMPERKKMMQAWADFLDGLKTGAKVIRSERPGDNGRYAGWFRKSPLAGIRHRRFWKAPRKAGFSQTVSAQALIMRLPMEALQGMVLVPVCDGQHLPGRHHIKICRYVGINHVNGEFGQNCFD